MKLLIGLTTWTHKKHFKLKLSPWSVQHLLPLWPHLSRFLWQCPRQPWPEQASRWHRHPPWLLSSLPAATAPPLQPCGTEAPQQTPSWCPPGEEAEYIKQLTKWEIWAIWLKDSRVKGFLLIPDCVACYRRSHGERKNTPPPPQKNTWTQKSKYHHRTKNSYIKNYFETCIKF